ncbi:MAG TPA: hypothetical protein VHS74_03050 [Solirubrobacterales bacterium]|nr:hypothetical protein [Solirubrobacterales bacterium]
MASAAFAAAAMVVPAAQAATPAPGYEQFAGCPSHAEDPLIEVCLHSVITGGHFQMGSKDVPITNPIPLNGGTDGNLENFAANSKGGLTPVKQKVPGGVVGLTGLTWLLEVLGSEALTLYAVTEAVGLPHLSLSEIKLPIRVHLINGALGNNCYVGSPSNPINLNLTTGTTSPPLPNKPISGQEPTLSFNEASGILKASNGKYVDNSFAAPGASGCVLTVFGFIPISINGLVNSQSGLPSAAGKNATTQEITAEFAPSELVYP